MQGLIKILWKVHETFPFNHYMFRSMHYLSAYVSGLQIIRKVIICIYFTTADICYRCSNYLNSYFCIVY